MSTTFTLYECIIIYINNHKAVVNAYIYKASQPRGRASGSRAEGRQEMQGVIFKSTTL